MASSYITKVGGVVIVTQVISQDEHSIPLETPPTQATPPALSQATPPALSQAPPSAPPSPDRKDDKTAPYVRGEPQGLGVVQIVIGLLCVVFSLTATYSRYQFLLAHAYFCLGGAFVVSGSLATRTWTSGPAVRACLLSNAISALLGLGGVVYACWLLAGESPLQQFCGGKETRFPTRYGQDMLCTDEMWQLSVVLYGLRGLVLVLLVLQVCVSVAVGVLSGKAVRRLGNYSSIKVLYADN